MPAAQDRVRAHTPDHVNRRIQDRIACSVAYYAEHPDGIEARLRELDREWDVERMLETNAAALSLLGFTLAIAKRRRRWLALPLVAQSFLLQHGVGGWCSPLGVFRRFGVRTRDEIDAERYALKALRGDFRGVPGEAATPAAAARGALVASRV